MRLSYNTLVMLSNSGDEQATQVLRSMEKETPTTLSKTEFYYQIWLGIFFFSPNNIVRRATFPGIPHMSIVGDAS